jgi:hypothetical protein
MVSSTLPLPWLQSCGTCGSLVLEQGNATRDVSCRPAESLQGQNCRVANVPMKADNFDIAYSADKVRAAAGV